MAAEPSIQLQERLYLGHFLTADWLAKSVCPLYAASRPLM